MATPVTITDIRNWMNDTFVSKVEDQLNREILAVELFKQHNTGFTDGQAIVPINYARNTSAGYRGENQTIPDAGEIGRARMSVDAKYLYSRMELTGPAIESGRNNPQGLKATLQEEIDGCLESLSNRANQYFFSGGGCIGFIMRKNANLNAAAADFFGNAEHLPAFGGAAIACRLVRMDTYALITNGATTVKLTANASSATSSAEVILGAGNSAAPVIPNDVPIAVIIDQAASYADVSAGGTETVAEQPSGILTNLCKESLFGLDRTNPGGAVPDYSALRSSFHSGCAAAGTGVDFESGHLQKLLTKIQRQSNKRPEMFFVEHGFMDAYVKTLTQVTGSNFRITSNESGKGADAGFNTQQMSYGGIPFRASRHAPKGCVIALAPSTWAHVTLKDPGMADLDGSVLSRSTSSKDVYEAFARYYHNLVAKRPNANGVLVGVAN